MDDIFVAGLIFNVALGAVSYALKCYPPITFCVWSVIGTLILWITDKSENK